MTSPSGAKSLRATRCQLLSSCALACLLLCVGSAQAAAPDRCQADRECRRQSQDAAQLAGRARFREALALLQSAYEQWQEPRLLLNIGRCHFRLGRSRKALEAFQSLQTSLPDPEPELASRLKQYIQEAQAAVASEQGNTPAPGQPPDPSEPPPASAPVPASAATPISSAPAQARVAAETGPRELPRPVWRKVLGSLALGAGAAQIGVGAWALLRNGSCVTPSAVGMDLCEPMPGSNGQQVAQVVNSTGMGAALLATGGVFVIGGIVLLAVPGPRARPALSMRATGLFGFRTN